MCLEGAFKAGVMPKNGDFQELKAFKLAELERRGF